MLLGPLLALLATSVLVTEATDRSGSAEPPDTEFDQVVSARELPPGPKADALGHLQRAQQAASRGRTNEAIDELTRAIALDETLAAAYLMRAQLVVEQLGDLQRAAEEPEALDPQWPQRARQAAADIERYIALSQLDAEQFEVGPGDLRRVAETVEQARPNQPAGPVPSTPASPPAEPEPEPRASPVPLGLLVGGAVLAGAGTGLLTGAVRIERECRGSVCEDSRWRGWPRLLVPGAIASVVGAGLVTTGAVLLARRGAASGQRRRRVIGAALLASASLAVIGSAAMGPMAAYRYDHTDVNEYDRLSAQQRLANTSLALGSAAITLLGGGIGLMLPPAASR